MRHRLPGLLLSAALLASPVPALAFGGDEALVRGHYYESQGDLARARAIYADILAGRYSERASREALKRLVDMAERSGDTVSLIGILEQAARDGSQDALSRLAKIASERGTLPPSFRAMATAYEQAALDLPSTNLAIFMAEQAEAGNLAGTGVRAQDPGYWYLIAAQRGSRGGLIKLIETSVASGKDDEAQALLAHLPDEDRQHKTLSIGKDLARGGTPLGRSPERAAAWLARAKGPEVAEVYGSLVREAIGDGDAKAALFWYGKVGSAGGVGSPTALGKLYEIAPAGSRPAILKTLAADARRGNAEAARVAARLLTADGAPPSAEALDFLLLAAKAGDATAVDQIARLSAGYLPEDPEAVTAIGALEKAANGGSAAAMLALARFYGSGGPVDVDPAASLDWYRKAAAAGATEAQFRLGLLLASSDPEAAKTWMAKAAKAGYGPARSALAADEATAVQ